MTSLVDQLNTLKRGKHLMLYGLVGALSIVVGVLIIVVVKGSESAKKPSSSYKVPISSGASRLDPKEIWAEQFTNDNENINKKVEVLEKAVNALVKMNQGLSNDQAKYETINNQKNESLKNEFGSQLRANPDIEKSNQIDGLRAELKENLNGDFVTSNNPPSTPDFQNPMLKNSSGSQSPPMQLKKRFRSSEIQRTVLNLLNTKSNKSLKTYDNFIPAGAFAAAIMVGGVDASTSISSSSDPRPVLLRITNEGTLPRRFKSDLCGCHVLAACYGDISSERVYMRLEKLTCTERKSGEIVEMNVQGYVSGEDGKAGLRGRLVDRAGPIMRNAAIGGFLSGMGNFLSQSQSPLTFSATTGIGETTPMTNPQMLRHGAAKGAGSALEKYADFYIKRAEQMQPVLEVQAGRHVDIVFTQGIAMEDSCARSSMVKIKDQQRLTQINAADNAPAEAWTSNSQNQSNSN